MRRLRWNNPATETLLARLGPIPRASGLKAVAGGVNYSHYKDLVAGTFAEDDSAGYLWCLFPLVLKILAYLPPDERVELIFGAQLQYQDKATEILALINRTAIEDPMFWNCRTSSGASKLAKWSFVPCESTILLDPSDYYANAVAQYHLDQNSKKAKWSMPILDVPNGIPYIGGILTRDEVRRQVMACEQRLLQGGVYIRMGSFGRVCAWLDRAWRRMRRRLRLWAQP